MNKAKLNLIKSILTVAALLIVCGLLAATASKANEQNQRTFLTQFVISGGIIVWAVFLPLSVITVGLIIDYCCKIRTSKLLGKNFNADIIKIIRTDGWQKLTNYLKDRTDIVSTAVKILVRNKHIDRADMQIQLQMQNAVSENIAQQCRRLIRKIEWLNIIGNVSPMVGLFGTVFGMIKLFNSIVIASGQPSAEQMADGISVALVTTFWGLLVAIPALVAHSVFANRIEGIAEQAAIQTEMILVEIKQAIDQQNIEKQ